MEKLLSQIGLRPGMTVALEGPPVYLADMPAQVHWAGYGHLRRIAGAVEQLGAKAEHWALLDEIHGEERDGARDAYELLLAKTLPPSQTVMEGSLIEGARELLAELPGKKVDQAGGGSELRRLKLYNPPEVWNLGGLNPQLTNHTGRPNCALLDATFNVRKVADLSIVVHPERMLVRGGTVNFREQQGGVLAVLQTRRAPGQQGPELPWQHGVLHVWTNELGTVVDMHRTCIRKGQVYAIRPRQLPTL